MIDPCSPLWWAAMVSVLFVFLPYNCDGAYGKQTTCFMNSLPGLQRGPVLGLGTSQLAQCPRRRNGISAMRMIARPNYFDILGVQNSATMEDIKKAYKKMAFKYHPDLNKADDAQQKFAIIAEAYSILSDPIKRYKYDQTYIGSMIPNANRQTMAKQPTFRVSGVVTHKKLGYNGVVVGVDEACMAPDDWIERNGIDKLPHGRYQKFFHVLPDLRDVAMDEDSAIHIATMTLLSTPFLMALSEDDEWPELKTLYVAADDLIQYNYNANNQRWTPSGQQAQRAPREVPASLKDSPIENPEVEKLFSSYTRGRYSQEGDNKLEAVVFRTYQDVLAYHLMELHGLPGDYSTTVCLPGSEPYISKNRKAPQQVEKQPPSKTLEEIENDRMRKEMSDALGFIYGRANDSGFSPAPAEKKVDTLNLDG